MDNLKGLIPEIYYDMIARVAAGVPFVAILVSPSLDQLEKYSNAASFILLFGLGYIAGHVLATISTALNLIVWSPWLIRLGQKWMGLTHTFQSNRTLQVFDVVYQRLDWAAQKNDNAGAILKKMEAGAALSDNLLSGWLVLMTYRFLGGTIGWAMSLEGWGWGAAWLIAVVLLASVWVRRGAFMVRQDRLIELLDNPNAMAKIPT